ncbi:putative calcium-binding protein CML27 [Iris pallida]|uniref:Calcium-binding protein CML27 n=1 Tax=Iris pallida TaxID=29817 RepID=A0AAX6GVB9_IRIPA|nr:putative calcium-binding protein CML27 [Iris pallida]
MEGGSPRRPQQQVCSSSSSPSFRLRSPSLNTLRLRRVFDIFDDNRDGEITIPEISLALDRLGLGPDDATELELTVSSFIRPDRAGLDFDDFQALHSALGDTLFGPGTGGDEFGLVEEDEAAADGGDSDPSTSSALEDADMEEAFRVFDEDGDGFISAKELQTVLSKLGLPEGKSMSRVHEMICSVDRNQDGRVDFGEFKCMMQGMISVRGT